MNFENFKIIVCILLAIIPVIVWIRVLFKNGDKDRTSLFWIFAGGASSVLAILALQILWQKFPSIDVYNIIGTSIKNQNLSYLGVFIAVGVVEEFGKHYAVRWADRKKINIETIKESIQLSLVSALGFAFAENIYYFYNIWTYYDISQLFFPFIFRSSFTAAGHMIFAGIFGYFYGISKFAKPMIEYKYYSGKISKIYTVLGKIPFFELENIYRKRTVLIGLLSGMGIHAIFNFMLQMNLVIPVIFYVIILFIFVYYLINRRAAKIFYDVNFKRPSSLRSEDEAVILELVGVKFKEKKFDEVIEICERLLKRDPDNNTARIFIAKAYDSSRLKKFLSSIKFLLFGKKPEINSNSQGSEVQQNIKSVVEEFIAQSFASENYNDCIEICKNLLKREPENQFAKEYLIKSFSNLKKQKFGKALHNLFNENTEEQQEIIYKEDK